MSVLLVNAESVADYLARHYKRDRLRDVDDAYGDGTLQSCYEADLAQHGFVATSHHDNVTGEFICWPILPTWTAPGEWAPVPEQQSLPGVLYARKDGAK